MLFSKVRNWAGIISLALCTLPAVHAVAQDEAPSKVDIFAGYSFLHPGGSIGGVPIDAFSSVPGISGFNANATYFFNRYLGASFDYATFSCHCKIETYQAGLTARAPYARLTPFVHVMGGLHRFRPTNFPRTDSGPGILAGGGIDWRVMPHLSLRLAQADYQWARHDFGFLGPAPAFKPTPTTLMGYRLSTGLVVNLGGGEAGIPPSASCSMQPSEVLAGEPVTVSASASNFNPRHTVTYNWSGSGVKVSGTGATAQIDTAGLAPGTYPVTANLSDGHRQTAMCNASFTVRAPAALTMTLSANPAVVQSGSPSTITAAVSNADNHPLTYSYSATAGLISGSGPSVTLDTTGVKPSVITVTGTASDNRPSPLTASANTKVQVEAVPTPVVPAPAQAANLNHVDFKRNGARVDNVSKAILDDVALRLQREPDTKVVLISNADSDEVHAQQLASRRGLNARDYLVKEKGIDPGRIENRLGTTGGHDTQIWLVPAGATF